MPPIPPWLAAIARPRVDPTQGVQLRTPVLGRQPSRVNLEQILASRSRGGSRGRRRGSSARNDTSGPADTPEAVRERLRAIGLTDDQVGRVFEDDDSGDSFSPLSPSDWLSGAGDVLSGVLNTLDIPRAALLSAAVEASDILPKALTGPLLANTTEQTDRFNQSGFSWRDFVENFNNRIGVADIIEATPEGESPYGMDRGMPAWARTATGFAGDVVTDPLNYIGVGLADDAMKVVKAFSTDDAIRVLGQEGAEGAAQKVIREGVNALDKTELGAISKHVRNPRGGVYTRTPFTGPLSRASGVTRALEKVAGGPIPRYTTLAPRGSAVGDLAAGVARTARKPLNKLLDVADVGGRGLGGSMPTLRRAMRQGSPQEAVRAVWTITKDAEARGISGHFREQLLGRMTELFRGVEGTDLSQLSRAAAGSRGTAVAPEAVNAVRQFFRETREQAHQLAGHEFLADMGDEYVPRILTAEARELFGIGTRNQGRRLFRESPTRARTYKAGDVLKVGKAKTMLVEPAADKLGRAVDQQIEDFLIEHGKIGWFETDLSAIIPEYVERISRQLRTEYTARELQTLGIGKSALREYTDVGLQRMQDRGLKKHERRFRQLENDLVEAGVIVDDLSRTEPIPWTELYEKGKAAGLDIPLMRRTLEHGFAQLGTRVQAPDDIVDALASIGRMAEPNAFPTVMRIHNGLVSAWKKMALFTPGYHMRNSFGGVYMNWLGDVDEGRYNQIRQLLVADSKGKLDDLTIDPMLREAYLAAKKMGVFRQGQTVTEIELGRATRLAPLNPFRRSRNLGGHVENHLRGAMFIDEYAKTGGNATEAFAKTNKYHFDYEDLGPNERRIRQYAVPFYTFTRRSIPLMLEHVVRNPGKINRYFQLKNNVERLSEEEDLVPEYFQRNFAIRLPWHTGDSQMYLMPDLPLLSLVDASDPNQAMGQLSPFVKTPYEWAAQKQIWKGIPLTQDPTPIPTLVAAVPGLVPALRGMGYVQTDAEGNQVMRERDVYVLQQFLPDLGRVRRLWPTEDRYEDRRMTSWLSYLFGIGARANTEHEQSNVLWGRYYDRKEEQQELEGLGHERDLARDMAFAS